MLRSQSGQSGPRRGGRSPVRYPATSGHAHGAEATEGEGTRLLTCGIKIVIESAQDMHSTACTTRRVASCHTMFNDDHVSRSRAPVLAAACIGPR